MITLPGPRFLPQLKLGGWQDAESTLLWDSHMTSLNVLPGLMEREEGQWVWSAPLLDLHGAGRGENHAEGILLRGKTGKS